MSLVLEEAGSVDFAGFASSFCGFDCWGCVDFTASEWLSASDNFLPSVCLVFVSSFFTCSGATFSDFFSPPLVACPSVSYSKKLAPTSTFSFKPANKLVITPFPSALIST